MYDFNAAVKPFSLRDLNAQFLDEQAKRQNLRRGQQEIQQGDLTLKDLAQGQSDKQALRDAYARAATQGRTAQVNPGEMTLGGQTVPGTPSTVKGPGIDNGILLSELGKVAPHLVPQLQDHIAATQAAQQKAAMEQQKLSAETGKINAESQLAQLKVGTQHFENMAQELSTAVDQPSYTAALQRLAVRGTPGATEMLQQHPQFDPQFVAQHVQGAIPVLEQLKAKQKDLEVKIQQQNADTSAGRAKEDKRHNLATEAQASENKNEKKLAAIQNRAALADNVEENVKTLEDIMHRRPELFGKISGNMSNAALAIGSNDPDKLAYNQAVENLSRANAGMHNMRSKYAIEGDVKNLNFKNGVEGLKGTVASIRRSAEQFKSEGGTAGKVRMVAPNGEEQDVSLDQVSHYEALGAKRK